MAEQDSWDAFIARLNGSDEAKKVPVLVTVLNQIDSMFTPKEKEILYEHEQV